MTSLEAIAWCGTAITVVLVAAIVRLAFGKPGAGYPGALSDDL